jgi:hypothetical protein
MYCLNNSRRLQDTARLKCRSTGCLPFQAELPYRPLALRALYTGFPLDSPLLQHPRLTISLLKERDHHPYSNIRIHMVCGLDFTAVWIFSILYCNGQ